MRDYGKVSPQFWIGKTGRMLRGNPEAQIVALYLMTSPHANMIGVFHCPTAYIAHETGLTLEGASKGLQSLIEVDFCTYDDDDEYVFVHEFAAHQVGESLAPNDNRTKGVQNELSKVPQNKCWHSFLARYAAPFNLQVPGSECKPLASPFEAPSKPETETGAETEVKSPAKKRPVKTSMPADFGISERVRAWAKEKGHGRLEAHLENFVSAVKRNGYTYVDWDEAFMEAVRKDWAKLGQSGAVVDIRFKGAK